MRARFGGALAPLSGDAEARAIAAVEPTDNYNKSSLAPHLDTARAHGAGNQAAGAAPSLLEIGGRKERDATLMPSWLQAVRMERMGPGSSGWVL